MAWNHQKERLLTCNQCFYSFVAKTHNARYCRDCVPSGANKKGGKNWYERILKYGIGKKEWDAMYFELDGICPICQKNEVTDIEHNHITGEVRGLVCTQCNKGLHFLEDKLYMERATKFLKGTL